MTQLGTISVQSIVLAQDGHDGFAVLHIDGHPLSKTAEKAINQQVDVEGVAEVTVPQARPTITLLVTRKNDGGAMNVDEIKIIAHAFRRALTAWAEGWSTEEFMKFTTAGTEQALVVYGD